MWKKIITVSLVLVIILSFSACTSGSGGETGLLSAQEIVNDAIESWDDIRTYQYDMEMNIDMAGEVGGEVGEATIVMDFSGAIDDENRKMRMDVTMSMVATGEDELELAMDMYLISDMMYAGMEAPEIGTMWVKSEMPEGYLEHMNQVKAQIEFVEAAQVEVIGNEKVRGVDCYILQLTPDMGQLWQLVIQQSDMTGKGVLPEIDVENILEMFQSFSVKQWIAKDTHFLTKTEIAMLLELTPTAMGFPEEKGLITMDITMYLLAYDYNQPVSIELPPEAEEAVEVPSWF